MMRVEELDLPALPTGLHWSIRTFMNNEVQAYKPDSRLTITVKKRYRVLGLNFDIRPTSYPVYIIRADTKPESVRATAAVILSDHRRYISNHNPA